MRKGRERLAENRFHAVADYTGEWLMNRLRRSLLVTELLMQALPVGPVHEIKHDAQSTVNRLRTHRAKGHTPRKLRHQQAYDPGC